MELFGYVVSVFVIGCWKFKFVVKFVVFVILLVIFGVKWLSLFKYIFGKNKNMLLF